MEMYAVYQIYKRYGDIDLSLEKLYPSKETAHDSVPIKDDGLFFKEDDDDWWEDKDKNRNIIIFLNSEDECKKVLKERVNFEYVNDFIKATIYAIVKKEVKQDSLVFHIAWNTGDEEWDDTPDFETFIGTWEDLEEYLSTSFPEEEKKYLLDGHSLYDSTGETWCIETVETI